MSSPAESSKPCLRCGADLGADRTAGLTYCSACGAGIPRPDDIPCAVCSFPLWRNAEGQLQCRNCGDSSAALDPEFQTDLAKLERGRWRTCFWVLFVLTPLLPMIAGASYQWLPQFIPATVLQAVFSVIPEGLFVIAPAVGGLLGCGFCLARLYSKPESVGGLIAITIAFGFGMMVVYFGVFLAGCALIAGIVSLFSR